MSGRVDHAMSTSSSEELKEADRLERGIVGGEAEDHVNAQHAVLIVDEDEMKSTRRNENTEITVKFVDVKYTVTIEPPQGSWIGVFNPVQKMKKSIEKPVLHGISGSVSPGEVLAILGPSGSGKTTFLSVMGGRIQQPKGVSGSITYNDLTYSKALKRKIGFVTQDDTFFPHLTVRETLMYAAILRLPKELSRAQKVKRADDTIEDLGLDRCKNTIIGGPFLRGISGGERKRVSIGHEILIDPSLLLLDEPTSGLDSSTALKIVQLLHKIGKAGRTVVTTIHQPSSRLFNSFTKLLLLSEGNSIYFGEASRAMPYFDQLGFRPLFPSNPADFLLDIATGTTGGISLPDELAIDDSKKIDGKEQSASIVKLLAEKYKNKLLPKVMKDLQKLPEADEVQKASLLERRTWNSSWTTQFAVLWTRGLKERRHELLAPIRFYQIFAISFIVGMLWFKSKRDTEKHVTDQIGMLFFMSLFWGFFTMITAIFTFPQERAMLMKERASDMYRLSSYFMSRTLSEIPMEFLLPIIFLIIAYWMTGLRANGGTFILTLFSIFLNISAAQGCGFLIGATVMDVKKGTTLASVVLLTFMLSGGYYIQNIPSWISWVRYIAFTYYSYNLTLKIQYQSSMTYNCGPENDISSVKCPIEQALRGQSLDKAYVDALALLTMVVVYRGLAYIALRRMKTK